MGLHLAKITRDSEADDQRIYRQFENVGWSTTVLDKEGDIHKLPAGYYIKDNEEIISTVVLLKGIVRSISNDVKFFLLEVQEWHLADNVFHFKGLIPTVDSILQSDGLYLTSINCNVVVATISCNTNLIKVKNSGEIVTLVKSYTNVDISFGVPHLSDCD